MNQIKEKVLLLLIGGLAFGYSFNPEKQWVVLKTVSREWKKIDKNKLHKEINNLYQIGYVSKENENGSIIVRLTHKGKLKALHYQLDNIKNKKEKWDGKWRMVAFDIPENDKKGRDALRRKLKSIGFCELQKSVFITHFDCLKEIGLLVTFFNLNQYVRFGILESIDNQDHFKKVFKLPS